MEMEPVRTCIREEVLSVAPHNDKLLPDERSAKRCFPNAQNPRIEHTHRRHTATKRMLREVAAVQLDLG
jgi:hypothetical protein